MKLLMRRIISMLLMISILLSTMPVEAFAAESVHTTQDTFSDVSKTDWFYDAVMYAKENGIFNGTGADTFSPDGSMTRAMYVKMLAHIAGVDPNKYKSTTFSDISEDAWYAPYAEWAAQMGITTGTGNGKFSPDAIITREQMATLTVRYFKSYEIPLEVSDPISSQPKDLESVSPWAREAVLLLWQAGLFKGDASGNFNPETNATRAEASVFSMRTNETVKTFISNNPESTSAAAIKKPNEEPIATRTYTIVFVTNGGEPISNWTLQEGAWLRNLPIPYKADGIFAGWYKNVNLSEPLSENEVLTGNMTLYAEYSSMAATQSTEMVPFISKLEQAPEFTIGIDATGGMTADQVKTALLFECLTNPDFAGITVTGANGHFTVAAQSGSFEAGSACKLVLTDERLAFTGEDPSSDIYNFTIAKPEVLNLGLTDGMVYIPASAVSNMTQNGTTVAALSVPVLSASAGSTGLSTAELSAGSFTYTGAVLKVGDSIAIYEGISPALRTLNTSEADAGLVAYVTITKVEGATYTYESSDTDEVLFTPDILPVSDTADIDNNASNHAMTVAVSTMTYTDNKYVEMGLDAKTTVDVGDFIAFYSGDYSATPTINQYEKITNVSVVADDYVITYVDVTKDAMMEAMALNSEKSVGGAELLENVNVAELEAQIEQQAMDSGFVDESAKYLAAMAMETDSFKELDGDFNLESYDFQVAQGAPSASGAMASDGPEVTLENLIVDVDLGTKLAHYKDLSGVRCELTVSFDVVISGDKNDVVIHVTGTFEEEVRIVIKASGGAVWKYKGIFPYIADYRLNAKIDAYNYTSIKIDASIGSFKSSAPKSAWLDKSKYENIAEQLKVLLDNKDGSDSNNTVADTLADKYSTMLENKSDWVELFNQELFNNESFVDPYHILVYGVKVNFVVSANMNVSLGCEFSYESAKRYVFSLRIKAGTSSSDTISLIEDKYQFKAYIMGTLGLKAGIRIELATGLFSLKLSSIGIVADVGAYLKLWGYFYYELTYTESEGKTSKSSGALFIEIGVYLKIAFKAQAFKGTFKYNPTLYENEWPLLYIGAQNNVNDFAYSDLESPAVSMAKSVKTFVLPDSAFKMSYMDMKTGEIHQETFDDAKDFNIKMSNSDFTYNTTLNAITVNPGSKDIEDGTMTITWKAAPLAFTSKPISRTVKLHWENLKDTYSIGFNSKGGSAVKSVVLPYNTTLTMPTNPQKEGYVFAGWYLDQNTTQVYSAPAKMPAADVLLYAKWNPAQNTKYTVEHYQQNVVNDLYTLVDADSLTGVTDATVSPARRSYTGFSMPELKSLTIAADGSGIVQYYYSRNNYTLTFDANNGTVVNTSQVKYGTSISAPIVTRAGYVFSSWSPVVPTAMPEQNATFVAQWTKSNNVQYKVEHYQQNSSNDNYTLAEIEILSGTTDANVTGTSKTYTGFAYDSGAAGSLVSSTIAADGSLVLKLYYPRNKHTLTFDANNGSGGTSGLVKYGASISSPTVTKAGYVFSGWSVNNVTTTVAITMPNVDVTYTAQWTESNNVQYKVEHYQQNIGDDDYTLAETENLSGTTNATVTGSAIHYTGFTYDSSASGAVVSGAIAAEGSLVLKLYYTRNAYRLTFDANLGSGGSESQVRYGASISVPNVTRSGYVLSGWSQNNVTTNVAITMPSEDVTYTAIWTENTNTPYKIKHYQQNIGDNDYTLAETENLTGTTSATVTGSAISYTGFTYDSNASGTVVSGTIAADGSLELKLYYTRNSYTLTFDANLGSGGSSSQVKYDAVISIPTVNRTGYVLSGWLPEVATTMPNQNTTYTAQWLESTNVQYKVEHYQQNIGDDNYSLAATDYLNGVTNATANGSPKSYTGFTYDSNASSSIASGTITADGTLVLKLFYTRNKHTLTFNANSGTGGSVSEVKYGATMSAPTVTRVGYVFSSWSPAVAATMPDQNTTYTAQWTERVVPQGSGTLANPYLIENYATLKWIATNNTAQTGYSGQYFKQIVDIDMTPTTSETWLPIGDDTNRFNGSYDGNGYSAENLSINTSNKRQGVFGVIGDTGSVLDLGVTNVNITCTTSDSLTGALVGVLYGSVSRCYSTGTVNGNGNTGGLIGYSYAGTIKDSYSTCTVVANEANGVIYDQMGGFIGKIALVTGKIGSISNCFATGNVVATSHNQVAGLAGEIDTSQKVYSCFAIGTVTGNTNVSGILGVLQGPMFNSYTTSTNAVGVVGTGGSVTGGGTSVALSWFKTLSSFTTAANWHATHQWDFVNTWAIDPNINGGLPYLQKSKLGRSVQ